MRTTGADHPSKAGASTRSVVVAAVRMMALAILAVTRQLSRMRYSLETPTWSQVGEHYLLELCASVLITEAFDDV